MIVRGAGYVGNFKVVGDPLRFLFSTHTLATDAPTTLAGTPAVRLYRAGDTTENATAATLTVDFDGRTGLHLVSVDLEDAFIDDGEQVDYQVVLTAGTVAAAAAAPCVLGHFGIRRNASDDEVEGILGFVEALVLTRSTVGVVTSQTVFEISDNSADDTDAYKDCLCIVIDQVTDTQKGVGVIKSSTAAVAGVGVITLHRAMPFTVAAGDNIIVLPTKADVVLAAATADQTLTGTVGKRIADSVAQTGDSFAVVNSGTFGNSALKTLIDAIDNFIDTEVAAIQADTDDIQTRLPAALVGGRMDANVGAISTDATAADNAEAFFDGTGYAGTGNVIPLVTTLTTYTGNTVQTGDSFAVVNSGTFGNSALKTLIDAIDNFIDTEVAAIQADTDDIQTRLPAALVGGRMDSSIGAAAADTLTASALAADAVTEIQAGLATPTNITAGVITTVTTLTNSGHIKKNTALAAYAFLMTDSTNHAPSTGLAVTVTRSIDGGAFGAGTLSAVTEVGVGIYVVDFAAGDLNGNVIVLRATAALSDDTFERIVTSL